MWGGLKSTSRRHPGPLAFVCASSDQRCIQEHHGPWNYVSSLSAGGDRKVWDLGWNGASTRSHSWLMRVQTSSGIASLKGSLSRSDAKIGVVS